MNNKPARIYRRIYIPTQDDWYRDVEKLRNNWITEFGTQCPCCNADNTFSIEHILPISLGGMNNVANVIFTCLSCNTSKGAIDPLTWLDNINASPKLRELVSERLALIFCDETLFEMFLETVSRLEDDNYEKATEWFKKWEKFMSVEEVLA